MGRRRGPDRLTVEDCLVLDIPTLASDFQQQRSIFRDYRCFGPAGEREATIGCQMILAEGSHPALLLRYTRPGVQTALQYSVAITATPCHFGGQRYWFVCPLV